MIASINTIKESTKALLIRETITHAAKATAVWALGMPPLIISPFPKMIFVIITSISTITSAITAVSSSVCFAIINPPEKMFLKYGRNIMYPATVAPIALIRTAPAATSLTALAFLLY